MTVHVPPQYPTRGGLIAFVGEAPGDEEISCIPPTPLVGPSGRVYNALLRTAGIDREEVFTGNVFDVKLPENSVSHFCQPIPEARADGNDALPPIKGEGCLLPEHHHHLDRLKEELERVNPVVIVPLGGTALWAFTGEANIGQFRGNVVEATRLLPGVKLVPTYHPAYILKQWKMYHVVARDFMFAAAEAKRGREIVWPELELWLDPTLDDLLEFEPYIMQSDLLSVDIETGWGMITCIGFAPDRHRAICVPFVDLRQADRSYWRTPEEELKARRIVARWLDSPVPKLGQNFPAYDTPWLMEAGYHIRNVRHDTRLMHHSLYAELPKDLAFMGASYGTQGAWKHLGHADKREG